MINVIKSRTKQGYKTFKFPDPNFQMPENFTGNPILKNCSKCMKCAQICPVSCISENTKGISIDAGTCIFCGKCKEQCPENAISFDKKYEMAVLQRSELFFEPEQIKEYKENLRTEIKKFFGRSLKLRQVSAGGCNACEADCNVLGTIGWDMGRFGIQFVASPRHADGILITGPVSKNMALALKKTYEALPPPRLVIAVGSCAISRGIFKDSPEVCGGADKFFNVDLFIPGCPPHPATILHGLLKLMGRL